MLGVDHDKIILLSTPFPTIPMLGTNCWCNVILFYVGNKRCCIVLYCIVLYHILSIAATAGAAFFTVLPTIPIFMSVQSPVVYISIGSSSFSK